MLDMTLCSCGSFLRQARCCGLQLEGLAGPDSLALLDKQAAEATKLYNDKKTTEAEAMVLKLLDLAPNHRNALRVLFEIRRTQGKAETAEILARRLAALPGTAAMEAAANLQFAQLVVAKGRFAEAEPPLVKALMAAPKDANVHHVLGVVMTETGRLTGGEKHYRKAVVLFPQENGMLLANLAWNLKLQGRLDEAAALYERALVLRPDNSRAVGGYAQVEMGRHIDKSKAAALLDDGLLRWPHDRMLRLLRAHTDLAAGHGQEVLDRLSDAPENLLPAELAIRGQGLALLNRPGDAVAHYARAKTLQRERFGQNYDPAPFLQQAERYKAYFTADRLLPVPRANAAGGLAPVFLLGFPRSGTSLLEQMLAQVKGFAPGDDLFSLQPLIDLLPLLGGAATESYPESLSRLMLGDGAETLEALRARYQKQRIDAGLGKSGRIHVTDRRADNIWHLGLIKLLFPAAPIIHVIRHPLDVVLSNFAQDRKLEGNCGVSLMALAKHYDLTMSLLRHYRGQLTLRYLPVRYEDLVTKPTATLASVAGFIGADIAGLPDEATLRANDAAARPPVPVHYAARQPIHVQGLYRHHIYQAAMPHLFKEILPVLQVWIDELGYGEDQ